MDVACIPPLALTDEVYVRYQSMHMFLPPLFAVETYRDYVGISTGYKILDNGAAEGDTYDFNALNKLADQFDIDEVVVPDVIGNCDLSLYWAESVQHEEKPDGVKWMGVVQGQTLQEVMKCWRQYLRWDWIDTVGVPRHLNKEHPQARFNLIKSMRSMKKEDFFAKPVHALGSHSWGREVHAFACLGCVRSMDTSFPFHMAQIGTDLRFVEYGQPRRPDFFEWLPSEEERDLARSNYAAYNQWAKAP